MNDTKLMADAGIGALIGITIGFFLQDEIIMILLTGLGACIGLVISIFISSKK